MHSVIWFNPRHPQTMQAAVILGYISGVFGLLRSSALGGPLAPIMLLAALGALGGAFGVANNKRIGWVALAVASVVVALFFLGLVVWATQQGVNRAMQSLINTVFPVALVAAVLHPQTREYMKAWFD